MGWRDLADIAILTLVLWRIFIWLRGTVAVHVMAGMAALGIIAFGAAKAGLILTTYVLQGVGAVAALLAVVIFQDEIRQALRQASALRWWQRRRSRRMGAGGAPAQLVAEGLMRLAEKRIGALVIIPRGDPVDEHITGGTEIQGVLSPELLEAIFNTRSPIHDGAVIVRDDRIERAGAVLPLASATDKPTALGTRHLAALGLSEHCDALVLVVSEERREISLASNGTLTSLPSERDAVGRLAVQIEEERVRSGNGTSAEAGSASGAGRHGRLISALALLVILVSVTGFWLVLVGDRSTVVTREMVIEQRGMREGYDVTIVRPKDSKVRVGFQGPESLLGPAALGKVKAWIELGKVRKGYSWISVKVRAPLGLRTVSVTPQKVLVLVKKRK